MGAKTAGERGAFTGGFIRFLRVDFNYALGDANSRSKVKRRYSETSNRCVRRELKIEAVRLRVKCFRDPFNRVLLILYRNISYVMARFITAAFEQQSRRKMHLIKADILVHFVLYLISFRC